MVRVLTFILRKVKFTVRSYASITHNIRYMYENHSTHINPRTAGGLSHLRTAEGGGADDRHPDNSKTKKDSESSKRRWIVRGKFYK